MNADTTHGNLTASSRHTVLLTLCGKTPAVITESVWGLVAEGVIPDEIIVVTTVEGRECVVGELFENGIWEKFIDDLEIENNIPLFGNSQYHIRLAPEPGHTRDSDDIRQKNETSEFGDFVLAILREFTENQDTQIEFSIAGGRKSMSAVALQCMSLLARPQDRAFHVLVPTPFDRWQLTPKFYYPTATQHFYENQSYSGADVEIMLHDIPFVRSRDIFRREYARLPGTFQNTVKLANQSLHLPRIALHPEKLLCEIDGYELKLGITEYAFFWMLCQRCAESRRYIPNSYVAHLDLKKFVNKNALFLLELADEPGSMSHLREYVETDNSEEMEDKMRKLPNRISTKIRKVGGIQNVEPLLPTRGRNRGYGLALSPENVKIHRG